jgi:23S rRNA pseudouridine1911/1915/1917 synthase
VKNKISKTNVGSRLDAYSLTVLPELNRSTVQKLIQAGDITVNSELVKTGHKLRLGDVVEINYQPQALTEIPQIDLPIIYEDDDCMVINKPVGLLTHSKGAFNPEPTIATFIASKVPGLEGDRAGIVHRLDRATSGVIICAKNPEALSWLQKQFAQRRTKKTYNAVIKGTLEPKQAIIDMPIERNPKSPKQFRVGKSGKSAQTAYAVKKSKGSFSLLELKPVTGRTHQIRVHLKQVGHPIVGDILYGGKEYDRLMLHAYSLELTLPSRERKVFTAPLPKEFSAIMK